MTFTTPKTKKHHKFTAKILVTNTTGKAPHHNDPRRGYKFFAIDIKDLIELDINCDVAKEIEKVEVTYLRPDLENPNSHWVSISVDTVFPEDEEGICLFIREILEYRVTEVQYVLQSFTPVPEVEN